VSDHGDDAAHESRSDSAHNGVGLVSVHGGAGSVRAGGYEHNRKTNPMTAPTLRRHQRAWLYVEHAIGSYRVPVVVIRTGPKQTTVKTMRRASLPGKRWCDAGTVIRVPTAAVKGKE